MNRVIYFAYGSNMNTVRLQSRIPSAKYLCRGRLHDKCLIFNKKSVDGSGKANILGKSNGIVWGAMFEVDSEQMEHLDSIEKGYDRIHIEAISDTNEKIKSYTYISIILTDDPRPYKWYKDLIISGAREHHLPDLYIDYIEKIPTKP